MNIFIVEDDKVLSLLLRKMIQKFGLNVIGTATTGSGAIEEIKTLKPDLILMDIMLEDQIDGIQVMSTLRKANIMTPVIYITGNSDSYNRERALETHYIDYLVKPIAIEVLQKAINKAQEII